MTGVPPAGGFALALVDTHCHLDLHQFDADRETVLKRAAAAGVRTIVNPGIDLASCRRVLALAERHEGVFAAIGVHPNDCAAFDDAALAELRELASHPKVVAVGEIGLDYYWDKVPHDQQKHALRAQLELAADLQLPVILHCRNHSAQDRACVADLLWETEQVGPAIRKRLGEDAIVGVWHAFSGDLAEAEQAYNLGLVLGLGGPITFRNARRLHELVPRLRRDRWVLETDAPYLSPHPHRGARNEPAHVQLIAEMLARLLDVTLEAVAEMTTATAISTFEVAR